MSEDAGDLPRFAVLAGMADKDNGMHQQSQAALLTQATHLRVPVCEARQHGGMCRRVAAIPLLAAPQPQGPSPGGAATPPRPPPPAALLYLEEREQAPELPPQAPRQPPSSPAQPPANADSWAHARAPAELWTHRVLSGLGSVLSAWLLGSDAGSLAWLSGVLARLETSEGLEDLLRQLCAALAEYVAARHCLEADVRPALVPRPGAECALMLTPRPAAADTAAAQPQMRRTASGTFSGAPSAAAGSTVQPGTAFGSGLAAAAAAGGGGGGAVAAAPRASMLPPSLRSPRPPSGQAAALAAAATRTCSFSLTGPEQLTEETPREDNAATARVLGLFTASFGDLGGPGAAAHAASALALQNTALSNIAASGRSIVVPLPPAPEPPAGGARAAPAADGALPPPGLGAKAFPLRHTLLQAALLASPSTSLDSRASPASEAAPPSSRPKGLGGGGRGGGGAASATRSGGRQSSSSLAGLCVVEDTHMHVQDVHTPSGDVWLLLGRQQESASPYLSGGVARGAAAAAGAGGEFGTGGGGGGPPQSLVLLTLPLPLTLTLPGDGGADASIECAMLGVYLCFPRRLPRGLLDAVWASGQALLEQALRTPLIDAVGGRMAAEYDTLRSAVPGSYAVLRADLVASQLASVHLEAAGGSATGGPPIATDSTLGSPMSTMNFEAYVAPLLVTPPPPGRHDSSRGSRLAASARGSPGLSAQRPGRAPRVLAAIAPGLFNLIAQSAPRSGPEGFRLEHSRPGALQRLASAFRSNSGSGPRSVGGRGDEEDEAGVAGGTAPVRRPSGAIHLSGGGGAGATNESLLQMLIASSQGELHSATGAGAALGAADLCACTSSFITVTAPDEASVSMRQQMEVLTASIQARPPEAAWPAFPEDLDSLTLTQVLGKGGSGTVFQGTWNSLQVAVKLMEMPTASSTPAAPALAPAPAAEAAPAPGVGPGGPIPIAPSAIAQPAAPDDAKQLALRRELLRMGMERAILPAMSHPNILQVYFTFPNVYLCTTSEGRFRLVLAGPDMRRAAVETCPEGKEPVQPMTAVVCEWADGGSLQAVLAGPPIRRPGAVPPAAASAAGLGGLGVAFELLGIDMRSVYLTLLDVALALRHLHACGLVHRDVKPANLLLRSAPRDPRGFSVKLADFGVVLRMNETAEDGSRYAIADQSCGTVTHMPPESFFSKARIGASMDVYSFGVLMWELLAGGSRPFPHLTPDRIPRAVVRGARPTFASDVPLAYRSLAQACWAAEPRSRPTAANLVSALSAQLRK